MAIPFRVLDSLVPEVPEQSGMLGGKLAAISIERAFLLPAAFRTFTECLIVMPAGVRFYCEKVAGKPDKGCVGIAAPLHFKPERTEMPGVECSVPETHISDLLVVS